MLGYAGGAKLLPSTGMRVGFEKQAQMTMMDHRSWAQVPPPSIESQWRWCCKKRLLPLSKIRRCPKFMWWPSPFPTTALRERNPIKNPLRQFEGYRPFEAI